MAALAPAMISPGELEGLAGTDATLERFAPWADPLILVDLGCAATNPVPTLGARSRGFACVVIGIGADAHPFAPLCDLVIPDLSGARGTVAAIVRAPLAALVLVQTLRCTEHLEPDAALTVESVAYAALQFGPEHLAWRAAQRIEPAPAPEPGPPLLIEREGSRLSLVLNRPASRNAISVEVRDALVEAFDLAALDASISEIELRGAGRCFSVGGDLAEFGRAPDAATAHAVRSVRLPARRMLACADRTHARVHGACIGAGVELPAFAKRVTARANTFFQLPEISMGLIPGAGGCVSLPRRIGRQRTAYLALSGRRISAATAHAWGLIDAVEP